MCDYCKRVETTEHAFLHCKIAKITWKEILSLIRKHEPNIDGEIILNYRSIIYNLLPKDKAPTYLQRLIIILINIGKDTIWYFRKNITTGLVSQIRNFLNCRIEEKLKVDFQTMNPTLFKQIWVEIPHCLQSTH